MYILYMQCDSSVNLCNVWDVRLGLGIAIAIADFFPNELKQTIYYNCLIDSVSK